MYEANFVKQASYLIGSQPEHVQCLTQITVFDYHSLRLEMSSVQN